MSDTGIEFAELLLSFSLDFFDKLERRHRHTVESASRKYLETREVALRSIQECLAALKNCQKEQNEVCNAIYTQEKTMTTSLDQYQTSFQLSQSSRDEYLRRFYTFVPDWACTSQDENSLKVEWLELARQMEDVEKKTPLLARSHRVASLELSKEPSSEPSHGSVVIPRVSHTLDLGRDSYLQQDNITDDPPLGTSYYFRPKRKAQDDTSEAAEDFSSQQGTSGDVDGAEVEFQPKRRARNRIERAKLSPPYNPTLTLEDVADEFIYPRNNRWYVIRCDSDSCTNQGPRTFSKNPWRIGNPVAGHFNSKSDHAAADDTMLLHQYYSFEVIGVNAKIVKTHNLKASYTTPEPRRWKKVSRQQDGFSGTSTSDEMPLECNTMLGSINAQVELGRCSTSMSISSED
ncbi:hypothetical protein F5B20DRAFT_554178 [Whalleya microplaca]|nr:hypothetical protein F5B20DRAFT_554178 [Whalleya microplaca]